eukprot:TRINITY_DN2826_c0_g1_i8.p1 TRINITY_DN2826_c0_g1~~TRINITY_DN2826_c0_g1_i8.p1  ORF type:complete len:127 (+),score=2.91 TRINITY_DN2826_c0_g1_i8:26-382(+)
MIRRPPRSTRKESSAASDVYKRQVCNLLLSSALENILAAYFISFLESCVYRYILECFGLIISTIELPLQTIFLFLLCKDLYKWSLLLDMLCTPGNLRLSSWSNLFSTCLLYTSPSPRD